MLFVSCARQIYFERKPSHVQLYQVVSFQTELLGLC